MKLSEEYPLVVENLSFRYHSRPELAIQEIAEGRTGEGPGGRLIVPHLDSYGVATTVWVRHWSSCRA